MKFLLLLLILSNWYIIQGVLEWTVIGKVTEYGQAATLFCNVSNCCPKYAGWDRWTPQQQTLFIDLKTARPNKKYDGKIYRDGYTLIIKNLTEKDLNISYSCIYGVTLGERLFLFEEDVFTYTSTKQPNVSTGNRAFSDGKIAGIIVGVIVLLAVPVVCIYLYCWRQRNISTEGQVPNTINSRVEYEKKTGEKTPLIEKSNTLKRINSTEQGEFMEEIKSGKEIRSYVRVQVIGKHGAGKTSLVRRLLGKNLEEVHSTDGIDITKTCQISTKEDGKWIVCEDGTNRNEMIRRLIQTLYKKAEEPIANQLFASKENVVINTEYDDKNKYESEDPPPIDVDKVRDDVSTLDAVPQNVDERKNTKDLSATLNDKILNKTDVTFKLNEVRPILEKVKTDVNKSEKKSLADENHKPKISDKKLNEIFSEMGDILALVKQEKDDMASDGLVECGIWDFAGEKDYYVTHQTFMTHHAIYILVASLKGDNNKLNEKNFDDIAEYIDFWFDSIHCFCKNTSEHEQKLDPPVIMVFTHTEEWLKNLAKKTEKEIQTMKEDYFLKITANIGKRSNHIRNYFFLSNTQFGEEDRDTIDLLKKSISDIAKDMKYFAEQLPLEWIQLENALDVLKKDLQTKVLSWDDIVELAEKTIDGKIDILAFLKSQHKIGNIIFFEDTKEYIILQPKWLVDCFRCLICDDNKYQPNIKLLQATELTELANTGCISNNMITQLFQKQPDVKFDKYQDHILKVMQKFDIIVKPNFKGTLNNVCQQSNSYYMPCMIRKTETLENIKKIFGDGCSASPWLTFEFEFLPLAYFNHILVHFMNEYIVCVEEDGEKRKAIFKGKAVFFLDNTRFERLILCFSKNAISLQIWKLDNFDENVYQIVLKNLSNKIKELNNQLRLNVTYKIKAKCSTGDYSKISGRLSSDDLIEKCRLGNYISEDSTVLSTDELVNTWLKPTLTKSEDCVKVFISHSADDSDIITSIVVPNLERIDGIQVVQQNDLIAGRHFLPEITRTMNDTDKGLLFITKNSIKSNWCTFELLIWMEKIQKTNPMSIVLLLYDVSEDEIPHISVLQEAPKIYFTHDKDDWIAEAAKSIKENLFIMNVMSAGNVAYGLVWSHYSVYLQYVLPARTNNDPQKCYPGLEKLITESKWYKSLPESDKKNMSFKLYEMVPSSCSCVSNLAMEDTKIKLEFTFTIYYDRRGFEREAKILIYSIKDGDETYYCTCEYPYVLNTMKTMEQESLASFELPSHRHLEGKKASTSFTSRVKKLQLSRFYYTLNSVLNHFNDCREKARVLLYNDEESGPEISDVLLKAIKKDLHLTDSQLPEDGYFRPQLDALESFETHYKHHVYVAHSTKHEEDIAQAEEIICYLEKCGIREILKDDMMVALPEQSVKDKIMEAATKCCWFIVLLTKNSLDDQTLTFEMVSALGDIITKKKVRVIPVVDRREDVCIPESLQWVTYIPYNPDKSHLKSLYNIVSGQDIPLKTELLLPAGYVSYGLAWGYVANYLRHVLPGVLDGIKAALSMKNVSNFRCQKKLFIIIPKSCHTNQTLKDRKEYPARIRNFAKTNSASPGKYSCNIYKILNDGTNEVDLFFVGQYAAPIAILDEMRGWNIAGVTAESMATEAKMFYEIAKALMKQAVPDKAKFCEFVFYDDIHNSLAEIMEEKIRLAEIKNAQS